MMETGRDMQAKYRETSLGGLARVCLKRIQDQQKKRQENLNM